MAKHVGQIIPCKSGLHWSPTAWDALQYAQGRLLHIVEARGKTISHGEPIDKYASRERRIVATIDATHLLRRFAADRALSVSHVWDMPSIVREYLQELDESKRDAARAAARAAAWDAAWPVAWDAAGVEFNARVDAAFSEADK